MPATRVSAGRAESQRPKENRRKTPSQGRSQALVDALLTAASRVLSTVGIERSSTTRIAERAGVSIGSLYQYFRNREELLGALVERRIEENLRRFENDLAAADAAQPAAMIEAIVRAGLTTYLDERSLYATLVSHAPLLSRLPLVVQTRKRARSVLASKLREHADQLAPVDPDVAAFVLLNAFMGVALMALHDEPGTREALQIELVRLFSRYLLPEGSPVPAG